MTARKPLTADDERHGTWAGAQAHRRQRVPLCEPCRLARNEYAKQRRTNPEVLTAERRESRLRSQAMWTLVDMHRDEYRLILETLRRTA